MGHARNSSRQQKRAGNSVETPPRKRHSHDHSTADADPAGSAHVDKAELTHSDAQRATEEQDIREYHAARSATNLHQQAHQSVNKQSVAGQPSTIAVSTVSVDQSQPSATDHFHNTTPATTSCTKQEHPDSQPTTTATTVATPARPNLRINHVHINRAPVLNLWVACVADRQGFSPSASLTFGKVVTSLLAQSKGRSLGIIDAADYKHPSPPAKSKNAIEQFSVFGMNLKGKHQKNGEVVALWEGKPVKPAQVEGYLRKAFSYDFEITKQVFTYLAAQLPLEELAAECYNLYEMFRPAVHPGKQGWGQKGVLDLKAVMDLADRYRNRT